MQVTPITWPNNLDVNPADDSQMSFMWLDAVTYHDNPCKVTVEIIHICAIYRTLLSHIHVQSKMRSVSADAGTPYSAPSVFAMSDADMSGIKRELILPSQAWKKAKPSSPAKSSAVKGGGARAPHPGKQVCFHAGVYTYPSQTTSQSLPACGSEDRTSTACGRMPCCKAS